MLDFVLNVLPGSINYPQVLIIYPHNSQMSARTVDKQHPYFPALCSHTIQGCGKLFHAV